MAGAVVIDLCSSDEEPSYWQQPQGDGKICSQKPGQPGGYSTADTESKLQLPSPGLQISRHV